MSVSSKITDDEMRYFQFKARQLYLLRKEDHEWNEFCKRNTCTCCSCQTSTVLNVNKEVGVQSSPKKTFTTSGKNTNISLHTSNKNLPQTLHEIKSKLEKIDLTLSQMKAPIKSETKEKTVPKEIFNQQMNMLRLPIESDVAESVKSVISDRRMQLIHNSLKMSLQRLQSTALRNTRSNSDVKVMKKNSGYFIPRDLEKQRAAARRAYLASLEKTTTASKTLPQVTSRKIDAKKNTFKPKTLKATTKSKLQKSNMSNKEEATTLVSSEKVAETKDENIETAIDAIMDDLLGETVLVINKIKHSKSEKSSTGIQNTKISNHIFSTMACVDSKKHEASMSEELQNKLDTIRQNLSSIATSTEPTNIKIDNKQEPTEPRSLTNVLKNSTHSEEFFPSSSIRTKSVADNKKIQLLRKLRIDPIQAKQIIKHRKEYWNYLEQISRTKKRNFDPWILSNLVTESLLDDCIYEISEELQDVPASLIADLYDLEFLQSI